MIDLGFDEHGFLCVEPDMEMMVKVVRDKNESSSKVEPEENEDVEEREEQDLAINI